jgi:zinc and cadmium transporter
MNTLLASPATALVLYCALAFLAALAGGLLPSLFKLTHTRLQVAVSFVAGLMLGLSVLGLLPHALRHFPTAQPATALMLCGFLVMFFLQRFLPFHHHDVEAGSPVEPCGHAHSLAERSARSLSWIGVALGLSLHSVFDGLAIAAAVASSGHGHGEALGLGAALAVILHKPFGALAILTLMAATGARRRSRHLVNFAFASVTPLGALLFFAGAGGLAHQHPAWLGGALAFCAGTFLCIAGADLLPELQFHRHDRLKLSMALLGGLGIALLITQFAHPGHDDHHQPVSRPTESASGLNPSNWSPSWDPRAPTSGKTQRVLLSSQNTALASEYERMRWIWYRPL